MRSASKLLLAAVPIVATSTRATADSEHALDLSYGLGMTAGYSGGELATASAGGNIDYAVNFGDDDPVYAIDVGVSARYQRNAGVVDGNGVSTQAHLRIGPAAVAPIVENNDRMNWTPFPFAFEIDHAGELGAIPKLSARPDVARARYTSEQVSIRTAAGRLSFGTYNYPSTTKKETGPEAGFADILPINGDAAATIQDGMRLDTRIGGAFFGADLTVPLAARVDLFGLDEHDVVLPDGTHHRWNIVWVMHGSAPLPKTGTAFKAAYGFLGAEFLQGISTKDHIHVIELGWVWGQADASPRVQLQYERRPYVMMTGDHVLEDRVFVEVPVDALGCLWTARAFTARTDRRVDMSPHIAWIGGGELEVSRKLGDFDADARFELGRSFYGELDGAAPRIGFAARGSVTLRYSGTRQLRRAR